MKFREIMVVRQVGDNSFKERNFFLIVEPPCNLTQAPNNHNLLEGPIHLDSIFL